ncbi:MAG: LLM class F420-dependent oxidoreductase [Actinobacteria bacterium]|nr:LLM class F420-dependent oxidoreductase [Actinomycetota bacterium]
MSDAAADRAPVGLTFASFQALGLDVGVQMARAGRAAGCSSFWTAETVGPEAFASLGAVGAAVGGLDLGTGVLALQLRTPMLAAMGAATLQAIAPDRDVLLGVGISSPVVVGRWHGAEYGPRPLAQVREYLELTQQCLSGEVVSFDGDFYRASRFRLGIRLGTRRPKLVLGALNRRMLHLAGELADGVLLNYLPASAVPWCVEQVRAGESAAGRPPGTCTVYAYVHVGVCDTEAARAAGRRDLFSYAVVDAYARAFERAGFVEEVAAVRAAHSAGDRDGAVAAVSDRMVDAIDTCGDAATVAAAVQAYRDAGVDVPVIMPLPWGEDRIATIEATIDAVTG